MLCETQKEHPDYPKWVNSIQLYGDYLKGMMKYTHPYGMIPSGVYHAEEYKDTTNFYALHLFPPANAKELYTEQIKRGVQLDKEHYMKRFPVWFNIFNGNTAIHLSNGTAQHRSGTVVLDRRQESFRTILDLWRRTQLSATEYLLFGRNDRRDARWYPYPG